MSPRLLYLLSALRAHRALEMRRDRAAARRAAARTAIGLPLIVPRRQVIVALRRLRDHSARDGRVRIAAVRAATTRT